MSDSVTESESARQGEPLLLYIGSGWDVEPLAHATALDCRRFVFVDCIPNRFLYWKEGEAGYEISRSLDLIVVMIRYKLALMDIPALTEDRSSEGRKTVVRLELKGGYEITYYFDVKYPDDFADSDAASPGLRSAFERATILFMKGYPPQPFGALLGRCLNLIKIAATDDNIRSVKRDAGEDILDKFEVMTIEDLDLDAIGKCRDSFEVVQRCIHMF